ncbi:non-specific lipid transfer protein GPI-anchored 20 [Lactuca sativa]|uniref:Bifunctional inhibitor/plant lipid transfer protein/seed storage helical domain-containing protein n=1 Tax=Lactuca sativa TaxID=4236 RepID=A0A9R1XWY9_LACSA|nr:non-specific lipid transfer protein GPI-anchored 20 [Lactuca sativa]XP_023772078.1 non-specific lipid transfer protein GPI-anchored 20 [Lactuca sativa]KAJ0223322.1 hypothetical protein LSAT_V11C200054350 [Lactuca sativa]
MAFRCLILTLALALCYVVAPVYTQINTPCTPSMITTFTPCLNFITNSTTNGSSTPTSDCCNSLKSITSSGTDCLCLIVTGSVPFQIPINQTLAISLPRACRMPGVPLQCKAAAAAPIPSSAGPAPSPGSSSTVQETMTPTSAPESKTTPTLAPQSDMTPDLSPPSTGVDTTNQGSRPTVTPSAAASNYVYSPFILVGTGVTFIGYFLF